MDSRNKKYANSWNFKKKLIDSLKNVKFLLTHSLLSSHKFSLQDDNFFVSNLQKKKK